ncbi:60S ribosomal protein L24 [Xenoophorus captivus]|uniref:Large ribosomal subunit protein eL24 n=1 Tax=Xenoophorus captivus TaxID=1517983 RepID=A0ABV0S7V0_9TELE
MGYISQPFNVADAVIGKIKDSQLSELGHPHHSHQSVFQFLNAKCESAFLSKRNPRQINWTVLYRRKHKKGQSEEVTKKRSRRAVKFQRAITGASLAEILAKRNQKPEVRKAQREQAIR